MQSLTGQPHTEITTTLFGWNKGKLSIGRQLIASATVLFGYHSSATGHCQIKALMPESITYTVKQFIHMKY